MRANRFLCACAALLMAGAAAAQKHGKDAPAPTMPYKPVAIVPPKPMIDDSFEAMRKQLGEAAERKDRAAMARLVVRKDFSGTARTATPPTSANPASTICRQRSASTTKTAPAGTFCRAMSTIRPRRPRRARGRMCAPADPGFDGKAFDNLIKTTNTDATEWGYPLSPAIEAHASPQANAPVIEKLGLLFVRIMPERPSDPPSFTRIATPAGKIGYVSIDSIAPIGNDQICYVKDGGAWKIGGYVGGGEPP